MTILFVTILLFTVNVILPVTSKDWFQHAMETTKWKSKGEDDAELAPCVQSLSNLNQQKPDGWNSFTRQEQTSVFDCMLYNTRLRAPSKLATEMEPICTMMLKGYNHFTWNFILIGSLERNFLDCISDRVLNYELEDMFTSSVGKVGDMHAIKWTGKKQ